MTYTDPDQRQGLINGLRALADFLESNPAVPAPVDADLIVFPPFDSDAEQRREIDVIALRIGSGTETSPYRRHYGTSRNFGPVEYRAVAIPSDKTREQCK
jgi:hypothetical protein